MATDYEKDWPNLRVGWAEDKINEWTAELEAKDLPLLKRKKLEHDIRLMARALREWKNGRNSHAQRTIRPEASVLASSFEFASAYLRGRAYQLL